ncbi:hypothetical protein N8I77_011179 [Diaporthe amygdali]|uniref:pectin lyase n=1 Tax=Phomopsis amygdali TaxID=1214568 RepID=A0AAD9S6D3_PHOAM|nr:pectin lyase [Diaporthe amygdali]KAJ0109798.1 pectin lyase [Diaporthe amygdali]KAK2599425.1 hypothetical protein N8I77_011179 [Diaporthe amygdali]
MRVAQYYATALLAAVSAVSAQAVKGTAYGFASGVTGGDGGEVSTPTSTSELADLLSDDTARVIDLTQTFDFTGTTKTASGCSPWGTAAACQQALDAASDWCGREQPDAPAASNLKYDTAALDALKVGSNKSIISSNGKGVLKGKGLSLTSKAKNIIIQGITITDLNPGLVWGGDALELDGNDGVWIDHCKFSLVGRMFIVAHYNPSRLTISNTEFDGETTTSATCNGNHYWTMMFYGDGDQVTLDRNYIHDCSGRAPKLGEDGKTCYVQAVNNLFSNMEGHAFEAYGSATALIEGNAFESVSQPFDTNAQVDTCYTVADASAASACSSSLGRACLQNTLTSSGDWPSLGSTSALSALAKYKDSLITPIAVSEAQAYVLANAGPENLASYSGSDSGSSSTGGSATGAATSGAAQPTASASGKSKAYRYYKM